MCFADSQRQGRDRAGRVGEPPVTNREPSATKRLGTSWRDRRSRPRELGLSPSSRCRQVAAGRSRVDREGLRTPPFGSGPDVKSSIARMDRGLRSGRPPGPVRDLPGRLWIGQPATCSVHREGWGTTRSSRWSTPTVAPTTYPKTSSSPTALCFVTGGSPTRPARSRPWRCGVGKHIASAPNRQRSAGVAMAEVPIQLSVPELPDRLPRELTAGGAAGSRAGRRSPDPGTRRAAQGERRCPASPTPSTPP